MALDSSHFFFSSGLLSKAMKWRWVRNAEGRKKILGFVAKYFLFVPHFLAADLEWNQAEQMTDSEPHTKHLVRPTATFFSLMVLMALMASADCPQPWGRGQHHLQLSEGTGQSGGGAHCTLGHSGGSPGGVSQSWTSPRRSLCRDTDHSASLPWWLSTRGECCLCHSPWL